jgi:hypothetical protein
MVPVIKANKFDNHKRNTRKFNVAGNSHMYLILMHYVAVVIPAEVGGSSLSM